MGQSIKTIKGHKYLYQTVWNPKTKKNESACMGNIKNIPIINNPVTVDSIEGSTMSKALNCDAIDQTLVLLVLGVNEHFSKGSFYFPGKNYKDNEFQGKFKAMVDILNDLILHYGIPGDLVAFIERATSQWRTKAPMEISVKDTFLSDTKLEV